MTKLFGTMKRAFGRLKKILIIPQAMWTAKRLFVDNSRCHMVITDHIGDFLIVMGYIDAFKQHHNIDHISFYVTSKMVGIANKYLGPNDEIVCVSRESVKRLLSLKKISFTTKWIAEKENIWIVEPVGPFTVINFQYIINFPNITLLQLVKYGELHLPEDASFKMLPYSEKDFEHEKKEPAIILCPYAQGTWWLEEIPTDFFERLASELIHRGYTNIYINLGPGEESTIKSPVIKPLSKTLDELGAWITHDDVAVGVRSGIFDYLAFFDCNIISIYPSDDKYTHFFSLDMLPETRCHYEELLLTDNIDKDIERVMECVDSIRSQEKQ